MHAVIGKRLRFGLGLLSSSLITLAAIGQVQSGRIVGTVIDQSNATIPSAAVTVTNISTAISTNTTTNAQGEYVVTPLNPGAYSISVVAQGFQKMVKGGIEIQVGQIARVDFVLPIGKSTTTIEVTGEPALLSADSATLGQVISNTNVVNLPLNGRGFYQLAELTPGAALLPATRSVAARPEFVNGNTISGIIGKAISFLLDGVDVSENLEGGTYIQTSIDALQEFSVQQNPYTAEFNRGGALFNSTTKSGSNSFHGGVFDFLRNDKLDARNYFALFREPLRRNQFGGTLGGPFSIPRLYSGKNRTFFFVSYEGQRLAQGLVENSKMPTQAQRNGDFSATGLKPIYDPLTTTSGSSPTRTQFTGNVIPTNRLSPQAVFYNQYFPLPNTSSGTYSYNGIQSVDQDQFTIRFDHQITDSNHLFARWSLNNIRENDPNASPLLGFAHIIAQGEDIAVGLTTNLGSNKVSEFRAHYLFGRDSLHAFMQGQNTNKQAGVTGFEETLRPGTGSSFPDFSWSGYAGIQGSAFDQRPKGHVRRVIEPTWNFTIIKGKSTFKTGTLVRYYHILSYDGESYAGQFSMSGINTQNPAASSSSGDAFADWMLGYPASVAHAYPSNFFGGLGTFYQFFAQDDYRVSRRLTVNVGLRYEYTPSLSPYRNQMGTFDPTQTKPIIVSSHTNSVDLTSQYAAPVAYQYFGQYIQTTSQAGIPFNITHTDMTQFAPRVGFAYSLFNKTVLRGGFGIFYQPEDSTLENYNILPFKLSETVNATANVVPTRTLANFFLGAQLGSSTTQPSISSNPVNLKMASDQHWSFGVQQQISSTMMAEVSYVANHGVHLITGQDLNDPTPAPGSVGARRPYPIFGTISGIIGGTGTNYNSLQAKLEQRLNNGLTFLTSYTWSKFLQSGPQPSLGGNTGWEKSIASYNTPQNLAFSMSYQLPFGRGKHFMSNANRLVDGVLGGWQLQDITVWRSGLPFTPTISKDQANTGVGGQRPIRTGSGKLAHPTLAGWFDKTAFSVPAQYSYGNSKGYILQGDLYRQDDASIFKSFHISETSKVEFRTEFFNLANITSFNPPSSTTIDTSSGGTVTATSTNPRQIQFALKYLF